MVCAVSDDGKWATTEPHGACSPTPGANNGPTGASDGASGREVAGLTWCFSMLCPGRHPSRGVSRGAPDTLSPVLRGRQPLGPGPKLQRIPTGVPHLPRLACVRGGRGVVASFLIVARCRGRGRGGPPLAAPGGWTSLTVQTAFRPFHAGVRWRSRNPQEALRPRARGDGPLWLDGRVVRTSGRPRSGTSSRTPSTCARQPKPGGQPGRRRAAAGSAGRSGERGPKRPAKAPSADEPTVSPSVTKEECGA